MNKKHRLTAPLYVEDDLDQKYCLAWGMAPFYGSKLIAEDLPYKECMERLYADRQERFPQHKYYTRLWQNERRELIVDYGSYTHFYCLKPIFKG